MPNNLFAAISAASDQQILEAIAQILNLIGRDMCADAIYGALEQDVRQNAA